MNSNGNLSGSGSGSSFNALEPEFQMNYQQHFDPDSHYHRPTVSIEVGNPPQEDSGFFLQQQRTFDGTLHLDSPACFPIDPLLLHAHDDPIAINTGASCSHIGRSGFLNDSVLSSQWLRTNKPPSKIACDPDTRGAFLKDETNHQSPSGKPHELEGNNSAQTMKPDGPQQGQMITHSPSIKFSCQWKDCRYTGQFKNEATLMRHISSIHVSPRKYECHCGKEFNRKDRYRTHFQMVHRAKE